MIGLVVRWICGQIEGSMLYLHMYIHRHRDTHRTLGHRLRHEWEIKLVGCLVFKNLDLGIRKAWDQMLAVPLLADQPH